MEGFLNIKLKPWFRRLITRLIAVIPAFLLHFGMAKKELPNFGS
jgi:manganese transport protein